MDCGVSRLAFEYGGQSVAGVYDLTSGVLAAITEFMVGDFQVGGYIVWDDTAASVGLTDVDSAYSQDITYFNS